jgi:muconolactone delta-isomerase
MPTFIVISGHSPESCPIHNEKERRIQLESAAKVSDLAKKYGMKVLGAYAVIPEHKNYIIFDVPSTDAFQKAMSEPAMIQWLGKNMTEIKLAMTMEDAVKMLQGL